MFLVYDFLYAVSSQDLRNGAIYLFWILKSPHFLFKLVFAKKVGYTVEKEIRYGYV
jgi:hypothetical protein